MPTTPTKVVFLIDEQPLMRQQTSLEQIKLSIMRILLFYHSQLRNSDIQWSYRFFSTQTRYAFTTMRFFTPLCKDSFDAIEMEYEKREKERTAQPTLGTPIMRVKQVLKEALGDFQWENTDICTQSPTKNYVYLFTGCPSDLKQMNQFFVSSVEDDEQSLNPPSHYPQYFRQTKEELSTTLLKSYTQLRITVSIIDTMIKYPVSNPSDQHIDRIIRQGFESCFGQFNGKYIPLELLVRNYSTYGHSYISEFSNILPYEDSLPKKLATNAQIPVWKGPFKTKLGKSIGNFVLFPSSKCGVFQASMLAFISEIRTIDILHASQFSASWLLNDDSTEPNHDYKITYEAGESSYLLNTILDQLFSAQQILIAELIPMAGYEELSRKVSIEPFSRSSASLRFLSIQNLPNTVRLRQVVVDEDYPVGSYIDGTKLAKEIPINPVSTTENDIQFSFEAPSFIKKIFQSKCFDTSRATQKKPSKITQKQKEEQVEKTIQLPTDVDMMGKSLKRLYLELLYTQEETMEKALIIIDRWITHLLKNNYTQQEIISTLLEYTMPMSDLEEKYREKLTQASSQGLVGRSKLEQAHIDDWWRQVKDRSGSDNYSINMNHTVLKLKEARLQVILYCFIARLSINESDGVTMRDPLEMAEAFFKKTVLTYSWHNITEFLEEMDNNEGPQAVKRRDPADLHDYVLMQIIEKCFTDLPHLTSKFREIVGMDEMASSPSSPSSPEDLGVDDVFTEEVPEPKEVKQRPVNPRRTQSDRPTSSKRPHYDNNVRKLGHLRTPVPSKNAKSSKPLLPLQSVKIQRSSSNKMFDNMLKRTVDVPKNNTSHVENNRGEATQEAIAKVNRSTVNGRPTIKRTGSFTKSAQSPKRVKRTASMLSQGETGTVILRRETIPNPQITPRTSLNRHLGTNIFADYSELCPSPSSRTSGNDDHLSTYVYSDYPQGSKTPQGTPNRYRKVMMNHTPHRENGDDEFSITQMDNSQKNPPYTPRTAAKRAKDVIDRSKINPGRNLTTQFQDLLEEEKKQDQKKFKSNYNIFDDDDDDEEEEDNELAISKNENINPFFTGSESPTRPIMRRAKTLDIFDENLETPRLGLPYFGSDNVNISNDSDSDDDEFGSLERAF